MTTGVPVYCYSITRQPGGCASLAPETTANNGYDADGNVVSYSDNLTGTSNSVMGTWTFGYDPLNRLTSATASKAIANGNLDYCWVYDQFGNRLGQYGSNMAFTPGSTTCQPAVEANLTTNIATYNSSNQMLTSNASGNLITPVYDPTGNTTADGTNLYVYDAEGRVCAMRAVATGVIVGYLYGAGGNRVAKGTISSLSCDMNPADTTIYNGFALTAQYLLGPGGEQLTELNSTGAWVHTNVTANGSLIATFDNDNKGAHFFLTDWLGTKRVQTNYLGSAVAEYTWTSLPYGDAFSPQLGASEQHYTGKERDTESGLDYFEARYYGSNMGRFMSPDQLGGHLGDPQTLNKYSYVGNNPLSRTDPTGMDFSLGCGTNNGTTCQGGNTYYKDAKGNYQETMIKSDAKGNLSDQSGNSYTANVSGSGVTFSGNGSSNVAGTFVNGTNATTINGSGGLSGFTFNFTYSETKTGISAGGSFTYGGSADSAAKALNGAGFNHYWEDNFNKEHPSVKGVYNAVDYRSAGDPNNGAGSGHFTIHVPVGSGGPSSVGDLHLGEHNPYTTVPGFLDHAGEVIKHHLDPK